MEKVVYKIELGEGKKIQYCQVHRETADKISIVIGTKMEEYKEPSIFETTDEVIITL